MLDPSNAEDLQHIQELLAGNREAFECLFNKYREKVYRLAFRFVRHKEDAMEITQDVFLRVYQNAAKFKTDSKFFTWLYRITVNRAIDFTRSRKNQAIDADGSFLEAHQDQAPRRSLPTEPSRLAEEREIEEKLAEAVNKLADKHRAVFLLHARENLSYKEIAAVLECNIGTVMSRLFYARKKLQENLRLLGVTLPGTKEGRK